MKVLARDGDRFLVDLDGANGIIVTKHEVLSDHPRSLLALTARGYWGEAEQDPAVLAMAALSEQSLRKYNKIHDPHSGEFASTGAPALGSKDYEAAKEATSMSGRHSAYDLEGNQHKPSLVPPTPADLKAPLEGALTYNSFGGNIDKSEAVASAMQSYEHAARYAEMNSFLRHGTPFSDTSHGRAAEEATQTLADAFNDPDVPRTTDWAVLTRTTSDRWYTDVHEGDTFTDKAFVSTSVTGPGAGSYTADRTAQVGMEIAVPPGTPYIPGGFGEVLLAPGTTFSVTKEDTSLTARDSIGLSRETWSQVDIPRVLYLTVVPMTVRKSWVARFWDRLRKYSPDEPRDDHGRWTSTGGGGISVAGVSPLGFSIHPYRGTSPKTGYQVAMTGRTEQFPASILGDKAALAAALRTHREANADIYMAGGSTYIGGWVKGGQLWLEPSQRVSSRAEAITLGQTRDQIAIWDNAKQEEIPTGGSGGLSGT